jgi:G-protein alpha subunit
MGVAEHLFEVPLHGRSVTWHLYDVGGARGQRHCWVPYFDEANAIIFVAPISAFDQVRNCDSLFYAGMMNKGTVNSIWRRIRGQTGLMTLFSYSQLYARTNS